MVFFLKDVLCAISYGSYRVRYHATNLLFHYWPRLNPNKSDRNVHYRFIRKISYFDYEYFYTKKHNSSIKKNKARKNKLCQSEKCMDRKNQASKVCIDPNLSMHGAVTPPPYHVCNECYREIPKKYQTYCHNIVQPVEDVSLYCENRVRFAF